MNWNQALMDAIKNGGLTELAQKARYQERAERTGEKFDYKLAQSGEREPSEDTPGEVA